MSRTVEHSERQAVIAIEELAFDPHQPLEGPERAALLVVCGLAKRALAGVDTARLDCAEVLLVGADFEHTVELNDGRKIVEPVALLRIPTGVGIGKNIRAFLDAARREIAV